MLLVAMYASFPLLSFSTYAMIYVGSDSMILEKASDTPE